MCYFARLGVLSLGSLVAALASADAKALMPDYASVTIREQIQINYYPVSGDTFDVIMNSIMANGPAAARKGITVGATRAHLGYQSEYRVSPTLCTLSNATITLNLVVSLPKHTASQSLDPGLRFRWQGFVKHVTDHELRHVAIYRAGVIGVKHEFERLAWQPHCELLAQRMKSLWAVARQSIETENQAFERSEAGFRSSAAVTLSHGSRK